MPNQPESDFAALSPREAARRLSVHPKTLVRWEARGLLKARRLPSGHRRYLLADVQRLEQQGAAS
jgi:DNA-binding transcriptional MerR regulator